MAKYIRMISNLDIPDIKALMDIIPTQSKVTLAGWAVDYAEEKLLPLWAKAYPGDSRPQAALTAAREMIAGKIKWNDGLYTAVKACVQAAKDVDDDITARIAARAIAQCCSTIHSGSHSIGIAFYGALAVAYDALGAGAPRAALEEYAAGECAKMEARLRAIAVEDEPNPVNIKWNC